MSNRKQICRLSAMRIYISLLTDIDEIEKYKDLLIYLNYKINDLELDDSDIMPMLVNPIIFELENEIRKKTFVT